MTLGKLFFPYESQSPWFSQEPRCHVSLGFQEDELQHGHSTDLIHMQGAAWKQMDSSAVHPGMSREMASDFHWALSLKHSLQKDRKRTEPVTK